jgi:hypothetical protein
MENKLSIEWQYYKNMYKYAGTSVSMIIFYQIETPLDWNWKNTLNILTTDLAQRSEYLPITQEVSGSIRAL